MDTLTMTNDPVEVTYDIWENPLERHLREVVNVSWNYAGRCKTFDDHLTNAMVGLGGEAGEILDQFKKMQFHTEKDRRNELISEFGDLFFYAAKAMELLGITLEECLEDNKVKLQSRHPEFGVVKERFGPGAIR